MLFLRLMRMKLYGVMIDEISLQHKKLDIFFCVKLSCFKIKKKKKNSFIRSTLSMFDENMTFQPDICALVTCVNVEFLGRYNFSVWVIWKIINRSLSNTWSSFTRHWCGLQSLPSSCCNTVLEKFLKVPCDSAPIRNLY